MVAPRALDDAGRHRGEEREARERACGSRRDSACECVRGRGWDGERAESPGAPRPPQRAPRRLGEGEGKAEKAKVQRPNRRLGSVWRSRSRPRGASCRRRPEHRADRRGEAGNWRVTQPRGPFAACSSALAGLDAPESPAAAESPPGTLLLGLQGDRSGGEILGVSRTPLSPRRRLRLSPFLSPNGN